MDSSRIMSEIAGILDLIVKYGLPLLISGLAVWCAFDLYGTLKKNWIPEFLKSFARIADSSENTAGEMKHLVEILKEQAPKIDTILHTVTQVRDFLKVGS